VVGEDPQPAIQRTCILPIAELEFAIARMTQDKLPACHAYFGTTRLAVEKTYSDREAGNTKRNGGTFSFRRNE